MLNLNNYLTNDEMFTTFYRETAHSLEPIDYLMDNRTGAMLAFDAVPSFNQQIR